MTHAGKRDIVLLGMPGRESFNSDAVLKCWVADVGL